MNKQILKRNKARYKLVAADTKARRKAVAKMIKADTAYFNVKHNVPSPTFMFCSGMLMGSAVPLVSLVAYVLYIQNFA